MPRYRELDSLRFLFALIVVIGHAAGFQNTIPKGWAAVDFFFVLSGFVLTYAIIGRGPGFWGFLTGRIARLFPLHLLALALFIAVFIWVGWDSALVWKDLGWNIVLLQSVAPGHFAFNWPSWSISVEFWANVTVFYFIASRRSVVGASITFIFSAGLLLGFVPKQSWLTQEMTRCLMGLSLGYLAYETHLYLKNIRINRLALDAFIAVQVVLLCWLLSLSSEKWSNLATAISMFGLIVLLTTAGNNWSRIIGHPTLARLGDYSFSIYLLHASFVCLARAYGFIPMDGEAYLGGWMELIVLCAIVTGASALCFHFFEIPAKRRLVRALNPASVRSAF